MKLKHNAGNKSEREYYAVTVLFISGIIVDQYRK